MTERTSIDNLILEITEHLAETDQDYRTYVAAQVGAEYENDDLAIEAIARALHEGDAELVVAVANDCLTGRYACDADGNVTKTLDDEPSEDGDGPSPFGP